MDFIPAEWLRYRGQIKLVFGFIGLCLTILLYGVLILRGHMARRSWHENLKVWLALPFAPVLLGGFCWLLLAKMLPWSITRIFGNDQSIHASMRTEHRSARRSCDYRLTGGPLVDTIRAYLCVSSRAYDAFPDQEVRVLLIGKESPFGFAVVSVLIGPPVQDSSNAHELSRD